MPPICKTHQHMVGNFLTETDTLQEAFATWQIVIQKWNKRGIFKQKNTVLSDYRFIIIITKLGIGLEQRFTC